MSHILSRYIYFYIHMLSDVQYIYSFCVVCAWMHPSHMNDPYLTYAYTYWGIYIYMCVYVNDINVRWPFVFCVCALRLLCFAALSVNNNENNMLFFFILFCACSSPQLLPLLLLKLWQQPTVQKNYTSFFSYCCCWFSWNIQLQWKKKKNGLQ